MLSNSDQESVFSRRRRLHGFIKNGYTGSEVISELIPPRGPHLYEKQLWDYKLELPTLPSDRCPTDEERQEYDLKMADIVKDAVSFYNSYGGYLVAGIRDNPREIVGFNKLFDVGDLNKKIRGATRHEVDCHFSLLVCEACPHKSTVGLLFVPQRHDSKEPAQFLRDAPPSGAGKRAYRKHDIYFRQGDECRPSHASDDYSFLCSQGRRQFGVSHDLAMSSGPYSNLGPRDPALVRFIGRENYLQELWRWLCDKYVPCKLLAGLGGVGKTTIAREFAEAIARNAPLGFEAVIWLSAKRLIYTAILGKYRQVTRVDFKDVTSLLRALLFELASTEEMLDPEWTTEELMEQAINTLCVIPAFVVIDDIDSLEPPDQHAVFHTMLQVIGQTVGTASVASRALLTARLDLGAAPAQLMRVTGLGLQDFAEYVQMTAKSLELPWTLDAESKLMKRFHRVTDGSPTFAASILRLLQTGEALDSVLRKWQGAQGEEVREFAFKKELKRLTDSQTRTVYAACILGETSLVELQHITQTSKTLLEDDIGELRKYHLLALGDDIPGGGARLIVPSGIRLMSGLIQNQVHDPKRIERDCAAARAGSPKLGAEVGRVVHRVAALWKDNNPKEALEVANWGDRQNPNNADLKCLLGRSYLLLNPPDARSADVEFRKAYELGCDRAELIARWVEAKRLLGDWGGIIEVTRLADQRALTADSIYFRAMAYGELGDIATSTGNLDGAAKHYLAGGKEIYEAFAKGYARGRSSELSEIQRLLLRSYVSAVDRSTPNSQEHVRVWLAVVDALKYQLKEPTIMKLGVQRLRSWWSAVESREGFDTRAANLMRVQLHKLEMLLNSLRREEKSNVQLFHELQQERTSLSRCVAAYGTPKVRAAGAD